MPRRPAEPLSPSEVERLMRSTSRRGPTGQRNRALIAILYRSGLRCSEALDLRPADIDFGAGAIRILDGKGHKPRTVGADSATLALLGHWLEARRQLGLNGVNPVFCGIRGSRRGLRLTGSAVRDLVRQLGRKAGLAKRVHAHGLRHSFAVSLLREGVNVACISKALGHSSIGTTAIYLDHLSPQEAIDAVRQRAWDGR